MHLIRRYFGIVSDAIFPPRAEALLVHSSNEDTLHRLYAPRQLLATALLPYRAPVVQACILEAKYHRNTRAQELLGSQLAHYIKEWASRERNGLVIVPVPLGRKRRKERGYNQTEEIAKYAVRLLKVSVPWLQVEVATDMLVRTRETVPQTTLDGAARRENMRGAFGAARAAGAVRAADASLTHILLDDVLTTGATLSAAKDALHAAGVERVFPLTLAH